MKEFIEVMMKWENIITVELVLSVNNTHSRLIGWLKKVVRIYIYCFILLFYFEFLQRTTTPSLHTMAYKKMPHWRWTVKVKFKMVNGIFEVEMTNKKMQAYVRAFKYPFRIRKRCIFLSLKYCEFFISLLRL